MNIQEIQNAVEAAIQNEFADAAKPPSALKVLKVTNQTLQGLVNSTRLDIDTLLRFRPHLYFNIVLNGVPEGGSTTLSISRAVKQDGGKHWICQVSVMQPEAVVAPVAPNP